MAAQTNLILVHRRRNHADPVAGADSGHVLLRHPNLRSRRRPLHRLRSVPVVAVHAAGMTIIVQQRALGLIVWIARCQRGVGMPCLARPQLAHNVGVLLRHVHIARPAVARNAVRFILSAQHTRSRSRIMGRVAGDAGRHRYCCVAAQLSGGVNLVPRVCMRADRPVRQWIHLPAHGPGRIVAGQAHLAAGTVPHQEILRQHVLGLNVRSVARSAFHAAPHKMDRTRRVGSLAVGRQRSHQVHVVL